MAPVIAMLSDFGLGDPYVGIMKGVILQITAGVTFVDLCHEVVAGGVFQGALQLRNAVPYFPAGTIFLSVIDPGVGGNRRPIAVKTGRHLFVGPDNGLMSLALERETVETAVHLTEPRFHLSKISHTFHGRDLFAPVAAYLAQDLPITEFGPTVTDWVRLHLPSPERYEHQIHGVVMEIDRFGNLTTNVPRTWLPEAPGIVVRIGGHDLHGLCNTYSDVQPGKLLALVGSQDYLEVACRNGSAQDKLGVDRGQTLTITW